MRSRCSCQNVADDTDSSVFNITHVQEMQVEKAIKQANNLADWHFYTPRCADGRITNQFELYSDWHRFNTKRSDGKITRQMLVDDMLNNNQTLQKMIQFNNAECELAKSKSITFVNKYK